jgi:hypothetical protein
MKFSIHEYQVKCEKGGLLFKILFEHLNWWKRAISPLFPFSEIEWEKGGYNFLSFALTTKRERRTNFFPHMNCCPFQHCNQYK